MTRDELLNSLNFGSVDSESEENLDKVFIQTKNFYEFLEPNRALLLGSKGAGKSALYRLFTKYEDSARKMAGSSIDNVYIVSGIGFKDVPEMDDMQLLNQIENKNISPEAAWKIYIAYKLIHGLYDNDGIVCGKESRRVLRKSGKTKDCRVSALIRKFYNKFVGDPPQIEQIDFINISISLGKNSSVSVYDLLSEVNSKLVTEGKEVWVLLDKIDELFPSKPSVRKECIEGLFLAYIDFVARYSNIKLKIFLRTDIWRSLSFVNKSHLTDKTTTIVWTDEALKHLLIKRAIYNKPIRAYLSQILCTEDFENDIDKCFNLIFPERAYSGTKEAQTMTWIIERTKDGLDGVYPRESINFANYAVDAELALSENLSGDFAGETSLISGLAIRNAYPKVSKVKVESYLSEFDYLSKHFDRFSGKQTAEFSQTEFFELMEGLEPSGVEMIQQMHETGVIAYSTGQVFKEDTKIIVPRLFRSGLGIVMPGRP